jgi:hypothetical protein
MMATGLRAAQRTVTVLAVIKWVTVGLWLAYAVSAIYVIAQAETWPEWTLWLEPLVAAGAIVSAVLSWAFLGYLQHMLATNLATALAVSAPPAPLRMEYVSGGPVVTGRAA